MQRASSKQIENLIKETENTKGLKKESLEDGSEAANRL